MTLRDKAVASFLFSFVLLMAGGLAVTRTILVRGFLDLERREAAQDLERVADNLRFRLESLSVKGRVWADRDETRRFLAGRDPGFPMRHLDDSNLVRIRLNDLSLFDARGRLVADRSVDLSTGREAPPRGSLHRRVEADPAFFLKGASGVVSLPEGPVLAVSLPVGDTGDAGGPLGILLLARDLDAAEIEDLGRSTGLSLTLPRGGDRGGGSVSPGAVQLLPGGGEATVQPRGRSVLEGRLFLPDLLGGPPLVLQVDLPREIHRRGLAVERYLLAGIGLVGLAIALLAWFFSERLITRRVLLLTAGVDRISGGRDPTERLVLRGDDELSALAGDINGMLDRIDSSQAALRQSEERLSTTLRSLGEGVITADLNGNVLLLNKAAEDLTEWKAGEAAGKPLKSVFPIRHARIGSLASLPVEEALRRGRSIPFPSDSLLVRRGGGEKEVTGTLSPVVGGEGRVLGAVLVFRDMTGTRLVEEELLKARKLDSIAGLAGGMAHDFDLAVKGILRHLTIARSALQGNPRAVRHLDEAERGGRRAATLAGQLMAFAPGRALDRIRLAIGPLARESVEFACKGSRAVPVITLPGDLWEVEVDPGQMGQVFFHLALNSVEAMPGGGVITLKGENTGLDSFNSLALPPGRYVKLTFEDEGEGIPQDLLSRVFDPFFTTREKKGGLGLAIAYAILLRHGGRITARSVPGSGAVFTLYLPAVKEPA